ncbi:MAG: hypothetical protein Q4C80_01620 [Bacillota bacterium]|nr:hypothetical protein [Bacillota bacterium]
MFRRRLVTAVLPVLALALAVMLGGCGKELKEPVFVKNMICSCDMDAEIEFITGDDYGLKVKEVTIPDMPKGISVDFYDEQVEKFSKYNLHTVNFGISADNLRDDGSLKKDFVFHKVTIKWEDGNETRSDIGTIHITSNGNDSKLEFGGSSCTDNSNGDKKYYNEEKYSATEAVAITGISMPREYGKEIAERVYDIRANDRPIQGITKDKPIKLAKGEEVVISYYIDESVETKYGKTTLEGVISGIDSDGRKFTDLFDVRDGNVDMPEWIERQIANSDSK